MFDDRREAGGRLGTGAPGVTVVPASWLDLPPGPGLAARLATADPAGLSGPQLIDYLVASERQAAWTASCQLAAVRELARRRPAPLDPAVPSDPSDRSGPRAAVSEFAADELAVALRISRRGADARIDLAVALDRLPLTRAALAGGRVDLAKVRAIATETAPLPSALAGATEARVLPRAGTQTVGQLTACLRRAVLAVDPRSAERRHRDAAADRCVTLHDLPDGVAQLCATGPAPGLLAFYAALTARADQAATPGDGRTLAQRRFDTIADLAGTLLEHPGLPTRRRRRPHLQVTVAASTLLGLDDQPAQLSGYGPVTAGTARRIAADATWQRILTDPASGAVRDYGRTTYDPPAALADLVLARDATCRFPGCRQPAHRCDLDHTQPYPGGPTAEHDLAALCRHHHRLKHQTRWDLSQTARGTLTWTTPTGHRHTTHAPPVGPVSRPPPAAQGRLAAQPPGAQGRLAAQPPRADRPPF
jgi:hypothetical protein